MGPAVWNLGCGAASLSRKNETELPTGFLIVNTIEIVGWMEIRLARFSRTTRKILVGPTDRTICDRRPGDKSGLDIHRAPFKSVLQHFIAYCN